MSDQGDRQSAEINGPRLPITSRPDTACCSQRYEQAGSHIAHLAYERNDDVIVMKGFKFARGRVPAAACLATLALANDQAAILIAQVSYSRQWWCAQSVAVCLTSRAAASEGVTAGVFAARCWMHGSGEHITGPCTTAKQLQVAT